MLLTFSLLAMQVGQRKLGYVLKLQSLPQGAPLSALSLSYLKGSLCLCVQKGRMQN